jgi:hypothetical protein
MLLSFPHSLHICMDGPPSHNNQGCNRVLFYRIVLFFHQSKANRHLNVLLNDNMQWNVVWSLGLQSGLEKTLTIHNPSHHPGPNRFVEFVSMSVMCANRKIRLWGTSSNSPSKCIKCVKLSCCQIAKIVHSCPFIIMASSQGVRASGTARREICVRVERLSRQIGRVGGVRRHSRFRGSCILGRRLWRGLF